MFVCVVDRNVGCLLLLLSCRFVFDVYDVLGDVRNR